MKLFRKQKGNFDRQAPETRHLRRSITKMRDSVSGFRHSPDYCSVNAKGMASAPTRVKGVTVKHA